MTLKGVRLLLVQAEKGRVWVERPASSKLSTSLNVTGQVYTAVVALPFHPGDGQGFAAGRASVFLIAFAEPFFGFAVSNSFQVGSYVLAIF
jgi:hypothetical protein